jgi:dTDP-glucose 4,6-dehydratase
MTKKVIISGTCGFIMGRFVRLGVREEFHNQKKGEYTFVSIDRMTNTAINSLYTNKDHTFYPADIRDAHVMDVIFKYEQPDIVIHGAALTAVDASIKDPNSFITNNVIGTQNIIDCCIKHKVKKLIYVSTDEVLGHLTSENDTPWTENAPINPRNPYSASKACGELLVKAAHQTHGLIYNITRSSNNYGPRQTPDKLIPRVIKSILDNQKIPVYGQGLQIRDWTYVDDNCSAIMTVLEKGAPNEIYNISANQEFTNIEVVQAICNAMGGGHSLITNIPDPRPGHDFRYALNTTKIRELGWKPLYKFKEGLDITSDWFQRNQYFLR